MNNELYSTDPHLPLYMYRHGWTSQEDRAKTLFPIKGGGGEHDGGWGGGGGRLDRIPYCYQ